MATGTDQVAILFLSIVQGFAAMIIVIVITVVLIGLILRNRRYDYPIFILKKAANKQIMLSTDKGGVFVDTSTKNKRFFLKKNKVGLDPDNIPFIPWGAKKLVLLFQFGLKNFAYIDVKSLGENDLKLSVGEEDVNWAVNVYEKQKRLFQTQWWKDILPYLGIILMGIFIIGIVAMVMKDFKEILPVMKDILMELQALRSGTKILPG